MFPDVGCREGDGSLEDGIEALLVILENIALGRKSDGLVVVFSEDVLNEAAAFFYLSIVYFVVDDVHWVRIHRKE